MPTLPPGRPGAIAATDSGAFAEDGLVNLRRCEPGRVTALLLSAFSRLAFVGNSLPRRCGIATFTTDLQQAFDEARPNVDTAIVAMSDHGRDDEYPSAVRSEVNDQALTEYARAADFLNAGHFDLACLQHEFGIFGGEAGG